jgi:hypothetical protein
LEIEDSETQSPKNYLTIAFIVTGNWVHTDQHLIGLTGL